MAVSMRQGMYRAIRPFRTGKDFDEELRLATEYFVVYLERQTDPKSKHKLLLRPRLSLSELEAELLALGLDEDDLLLDAEKGLVKSLDTFIETPAVNPFYSREG